MRNNKQVDVVAETTSGGECGPRIFNRARQNSVRHAFFNRENGNSVLEKDADALANRGAAQRTGSQFLGARHANACVPTRKSTANKTTRGENLATSAKQNKDENGYLHGTR